jgi:ABC-type enterobactin transport system permease subunit
MLLQLQNHAVRIVMGVAFYLFGFFVVANALDLDDREIAVGLIAGSIGGVTMLIAVIRQERAVHYCPHPSAS